jgi:transposase
MPYAFSPSMSASYLPYLPDQQLLLPPALEDWLPEGHLAYYISDTVDSLDLSAFHARYAGGGPRNQPFHPAMMAKVMIYAYATGVFSSRKIARKLHEDVAFRVLGAGNFPKHRTICDFRALHLQEFSEVFVQVVRLAGECGLVKLGTVAVDGTKIKANASRHKAMSYKHMRETEQELKAQIAALLDKAQSADAAERNEPETDIPAEIECRQERLRVIAAAKERLEHRQRELDAARGRAADDERIPRNQDGKPKRGPRYKREFGVPDDSAQESFTDSDSRIMKSSGGGFEYSYNAHAAVDETAHIVVAAELTNNAADNDRLPVLLETVTGNVGAVPRKMLADAGFRAEAVFAGLANHDTELVVALGREGKRSLKIDAQACPHTAAMAAKLASNTGQAAYRKRKWLAEPPNGWIKNVLGFRQFSLRGLKKVSAEWKLVCMALNLRRMCALRSA